MDWRDHLRGDPLPWLLDADTPAVRAAALQRLLDRKPNDPELHQLRAAAMDVDPIATILRQQHPDGWWVKPGPGCSPKYTGTVWQLIFLAQLGADGEHPQVSRACDYVLEHTVAATGGFGVSGAKGEGAPPPSAVLHCLNGNLIQAMATFGRTDDPRVRDAIDWAARTITGEGVGRWYGSGTSGPCFACAGNERRPCAWGALKELGGLARIPPSLRTPLVDRAIAAGVDFLFSTDPATADYPMGWGNTKPNGSWFKLGFPRGYVCDVLETVEVLAALGHGCDPRLVNAVNWIESQQDPHGRWQNRYAYNGKTSVDIEKQGQPSKWVTLRACVALRAALG